MKTISLLELRHSKKKKKHELTLAFINLLLDSENWILINRPFINFVWKWLPV